MQSAPLRHQTDNGTEFPFTPSPSQSPRQPITRSRTSFASPLAANKQQLSGDKLLALFKGDEELAKKHEMEQKGYGEKREQYVFNSFSPSPPFPLPEARDLH